MFHIPPHEPGQQSQRTTVSPRLRTIRSASGLALSNIEDEIFDLCMKLVDQPTTNVDTGLPCFL